MVIRAMACLCLIIIKIRALIAVAPSVNQYLLADMRRNFSISIIWCWVERMTRISAFSLEMSSKRMFHFQKTGITLHPRFISPVRITDNQYGMGEAISEDRFPLVAECKEFYYGRRTAEILKIASLVF